MSFTYLRVEEFDELQERSRVWREKNFPVEGTVMEHLKDQTLGVCEESGELAHSVLKMGQGIRGSQEEHITNAVDAVGDIIIYLCGAVDRLRDLTGREITLSGCVNRAWQEVEARDWTKNKEDGNVG